MNSFLQKFSGNIKGVITGFDRIVFKGCLRPLMFPEGAMSFLRSRGVLNKNYKSWVVKFRTFLCVIGFTNKPSVLLSWRLL